jgi:hypothetical protein
MVPLTRSVIGVIVLTVLVGCQSLMRDRPYTLELPERGELVKVFVSCPVVPKIDFANKSNRDSLDGSIRTFEGSFNDGALLLSIRQNLQGPALAWRTWGPVTLPLGTISMQLTFRSGATMWFRTRADLKWIWNMDGHRSPSQEERKALMDDLAPCFQ